MVQTGKYSIIKDAFSNTNNYFSTAQIRELLLTINSESDRLALAKLSYARVSNSAQFTSLYDLFYIQSSRDELLILGQSIGYNELAKLHGLPKVGNNWKNHPLMPVFEMLDCEDASAGRALRTSIVVREDTKRPGPGFYLSLSMRRKIRVVTVAEKEGAYQRERAQAIAYATCRQSAISA